MQDLELPGGTVDFEMVPAAQPPPGSVADVTAIGLDDPNQPADPTLGTPTPVGPPIYGGISGAAGDFRFVMDLEDRFLHTIAWRPGVSQRSDDQGWVCGMHIDSTTSAGTVPGPNSISFTELCSESSRLSELNAVGAITRIDGCSVPDNPVEALNGVLATGHALNANGTIKYHRWGTSYGGTGSCGTLNAARCPTNTAATGIAIHHSEYTVMGPEPNIKYIVGLELICREIGLR